MAGLIYGLLNNFDSQHIVNFAAAAAFGKFGEQADATNQTTDDIENTLKQYE